jgi:multiple sugar transport system permease protein
VSRQRLRTTLWAYLFLAFPLLMFLLYAVYPIVWTLVISFQVYHPVQSRWVGLANYRALLSNDLVWNAVRVTATYTAWTVPVGIALALLVSAFVYQASARAQLFFKSAYYLPGVTSAVVLALVWQYMFDPAYGLLNYLLSLAGRPGMQWLADYRTALPSLILMALVGGQGAAIIFTTAAMGSIPREVYEAARIDGAGWLTEFRSITLPLLRPTLLYLLVIATIGSFQVFTPAYVMTKGGPSYATNTLVYQIYDSAFNQMNFSLAAAESVLVGVVLIAVSAAQYRWLSTDVEY